MPRALILEADRANLSGFESALPALGAQWRMQAWADADAMLGELKSSPAATDLISLEAALAAPVVEHLAARKPACPVTVHWRNRTGDAAWGFFRRLSSTGWHVDLLRHFPSGWTSDPAYWHLNYWLPAVQELLLAATDSRANRMHAANCERLRAQFEGREAIYVEKYVRRVRVWDIRANVDARYVRAMAEEILTAGLGAPINAGLPSRWRFGGGYPSRFSRDMWSLSAQHVHWQLLFSRQLIDAVVALAATLPSEEVYRSDRLAKLISEHDVKCYGQTERVFPD